MQQSFEHFEVERNQIFVIWKKIKLIEFTFRVQFVLIELDSLPDSGTLETFFQTLENEIKFGFVSVNKWILQHKFMDFNQSYATLVLQLIY